MDNISIPMDIDYGNSMDSEITNSLSQTLEEELRILCRYVGNSNFKIFQKIYYTNIKKLSYVQVLAKVTQHTHNYNNYIMNFLERYPQEVINYHNNMFIGSDNCMCYCNLNLILIFIERYPQVIAKNLNHKGQNTLMAFCSTLFCNYENNSCNFVDVINKLYSSGINFLHSDNNGNTILHTICRNITIDHHNLVNVLLQYTINIMGSQVHWIINNINNFGYTALNYLTLSNNQYGMQLLLQKSATVTKYDEMFFNANPALQTLVDNISIDNLVGALETCKI